MHKRNAGQHPEYKAYRRYKMAKTINGAFSIFNRAHAVRQQGNLSGPDGGFGKSKYPPGR